MKTLIVEDDNISRLVLSKYLSRYGEIDVAENGMEALNLFKDALETDDLYDLVCMDIMMPKLDGIKTLKEIKKLEKKYSIKKINRVKVIMITALNDEKSLKECYTNGCDAYLWKPIEFSVLLDVLIRLNLIEKKQTGR